MTAALVLFVAASGPLDALEAKYRAGTDSSGRTEARVAREVVDGVKKLIVQDKLKTGDDFRRAATIWTTSDWEFESTRNRYELVLTAVALGDAPARKLVPLAWDVLLLSMGRRQRFGSIDPPLEFKDEKFEEDPTATIVRDVIQGSSAGRSVDLPDNAEVKGIVDADQAARQGDWLKKSVSELEALVREDRVRLRRIKEIVAEGKLATAQDFFNAALTMQHGAEVRDFAMAHELCLCSVFLGDGKDARWLAAASYDRMLRNGGHRQRFATQYDGNGLQKVDPDGINDTMRKALRCPTLAAAKKRVFK